MRTRPYITLILVLQMAASATAMPGDPAPQQKLMAARAAQLDAYRRMAERISGLQVSSETYVRDFITESDEIRTSLDAFLKGIRITETRHFADGTAEVDAEVTIQQVVETLKRVVDEVYRGGRWKREQFDDISRRTHLKIIQVTGSGAARNNSPVPDPVTSPIFVTDGPRRSRTIDLPPIYGEHPPQKRLMAKRAAEVDAYRKLLERIYGLEISSGTYVRDFITERDEIRTAVEGTLRGMRTDSVRYAADGVVEVELSVTIQQVVETVRTVRDEVFRHGRWKTETFEDISRRSKRKVITVLGTGALDTHAHPGDDGWSDDGAPEQIIIIE